MYIRKSLEGALTTGGHINRASDLRNVDADREYSVPAERRHFEIFDLEVLMKVCRCDAVKFGRWYQRFGGVPCRLLHELCCTAVELECSAQ